MPSCDNADSCARRPWRVRPVTTPRLVLRGAAVAAALLILPSPASACQVIGMFNAGPGAAPTPICAGQGGGGGYSGGDGAHPAEMMYRIVTGIIRIVKRERARGRAARELREALEANPDYQAYMTGRWTYFDSGSMGDGGPRRCGATFMKEGRAIMLYGNNDPDSMAMLTFIDLDPERSRIPRSTEPRLVKVSLDQTGAPRANVSAYNHETGESGSITFAVPSLRAGVDGLTDTLRTRVRMNDKQVFDLEYHSGHEAQQRMRACLDATS